MPTASEGQVLPFAYCSREGKRQDLVPCWLGLFPEEIFSMGAPGHPGTGLVQQTDQVAASRDQSLFVGRHEEVVPMFKSLEELDAASREFDSLVPHGEESFMVLKAHLVAERALVEFVKARVTDVEFHNKFLGGDSPCRNGLGLILLAEGLGLRDEVPHTYAEVVWPALKLLNRIRNTLVHELDPASTKLKSRMNKFIKLACTDMLEVEPDINKAFHKCASLLVIYLKIDQRPLLASDID